MERIHITLLGRCNAGKSSLVNALAGQSVSVVAQQAGTTTDPVAKSIELPGLGACLLTDTPGFDDTSELGGRRIERTLRAIEHTDVALLLAAAGDDLAPEREWLGRLRVPAVVVLAQADRQPAGAREKLERGLGRKAVAVSALTGEGIDELLTELARALPADRAQPDLTEGLCSRGDTVLLVMPQDASAPKGRVILPQAQTLRELLDKGCRALCATADDLPATLALLAAPPQLVVTDSQCFGAVAAACPPGVRLTSFSILFARRKGDLGYFMQGARRLASLEAEARVLIAEACSHVPQHEDIGRVKLPALLRRRFGERLRIDHTSGGDFPADLAAYDLVIHCGACMFNRRHVLSRVERARAQGVAMTNYGVALAWLQGVDLDRIARS